MDKILDKFVYEIVELDDEIHLKKVKLKYINNNIFENRSTARQKAVKLSNLTLKKVIYKDEE